MKSIRLKPRFLICLGTLALLMVIEGPLPAQQPIEVLPIGNLARLDDPTPTTWGIAGNEMIHVRATVKGVSPILRTERWDARLVEILRRYQDLSLEWEYVERIGHRLVVNLGEYSGGRLVVVHRYLLIEVTPEDARAADVHIGILTDQWCKSVDSGLGGVVPRPNRFY